MNNISEISECKPKGNYAVSYANAQTFKGGTQVSLDAPIDTFAKQDVKQNKHTALKVFAGIAVGITSIIGVLTIGVVTRAFLKGGYKLPPAPFKNIK